MCEVDSEVVRPKRLRMEPTTMTSSNDSCQETPISTEYETQMEDMPTEILETFVECMAPLSRLRFQMVSKYFRSTVQGYRTQTASEPWILITSITPGRVFSLDSSMECESPLCWALEPTTMKWCSLTLPVIDRTASRNSILPVTVHSVGSSGLFVMRHLRTTDLMVGNPMTNEWHKVANSPLRLSREENGFAFKGIDFAVHLAVCERQKEKPSKLVLFSRQQDATHTTISALWYCFSSKEWKNGKDMAQITIGTGRGDLATVHNTICTNDHTDAGVVFILVSQGCSSRRQYLVVSYSVALNEFTVAIPWSKVPNFRYSWMNVVLSFVPDPAIGTTLSRQSSLRAPVASWGNRVSEKVQLKSDEYNTRKRGFEHRGAIMGDGLPAWMEGLVQGLQLLVVHTSGTRSVNIQVLQNDPVAKAWKAVVPPVQREVTSCAKDKSTLLQLQTIVSPSISPGRGAASFQMARSGQQSVLTFMAASSDVDGYCTQVGRYNMDTGELKMVATPELPTDLQCEESKFSIQYFHPNLTQRSRMQALHF